MDGSGSIMLASTLLAQSVAKRFGLDLSQSSVLMLVSHQLLTRIAGLDPSNLLAVFQGALFNEYLIFSLLAVVGFTMAYYAWNKPKELVRRHGYTINVYLKNDIDIFLEYLEMNSAKVETAKPTSVDHGDPYLIAHAYAQTLQSTAGSSSGGIFYCRPNSAARSMDEIQDRASLVKSEINTVNAFHDQNFGVNGTYKWCERKEEITTFGTSSASNSGGKTILPIPYIQIFISEASEALKRPTNYLTAIKEWLVKEQQLRSLLFYVQVIYDHGECSSNHYKMFDGKRQDIETLERTFIHTFFQKHMMRIWSRIKTIDQNPCSIRDLGQSPQAGYLLYGPPGTGKSSFPYRVARTLNRHLIAIDIRTVPNRSSLYQLMRSPRVNRVNLLPKDVVFIFDEFDLTVNELAQRNVMNRNIYEAWSKDVTGFHSMFKTGESANDIDKKKNIGAMRLNSTGFGGDDDIQLNDLLTIFQGTVPSEQALMFATSNEYHKIRDLCPALFRDGRLTPVLFDHFDLDALNHFTTYHFGQPFHPNQDLKVNLCPSSIVEALADAVALTRSTTTTTVTAIVTATTEKDTACKSSTDPPTSATKSIECSGKLAPSTEPSVTMLQSDANLVTKSIEYGAKQAELANKPSEAAINKALGMETMMTCNSNPIQNTQVFRLFQQRVRSLLSLSPSPSPPPPSTATAAIAAAPAIPLSPLSAPAPLCK